MLKRACIAQRKVNLQGGKEVAKPNVNLNSTKYRDRYNCFRNI